MTNQKEQSASPRRTQQFFAHSILICVSVIVLMGMALGHTARVLYADSLAQDPDATALLKQSAKMLREAAAEASGSERACYLTWAQYIDCQAEKLGRGAHVRCGKPTCDFDNPQLAAALAMADTDDENDDATDTPT